VGENEGAAMTRVGHFYNASLRSEFRIFAPLRQRLAVVLTERGVTIPLARDALGYWCGQTERLPAGTRYLIEIEGARVPDPASRRQPEGAHAASMVDAPQRAVSPGWHGVRIDDAIIYELHVGTFTPQGTLRAACERLAHLHDLGITVIELMPLAAFPGERNWGYDGTYLFALHHAYGDYADLKAFIEQAHALGMAVILDVVYNHFGPEGNYAGAFAPYTKAADTPWGAAINFDDAYNHGVREFFVENLRYWLEDIGFDGCRMDAVSLIFDNMPRHILRECTDLARAIGAREGREVLMIAEHLRNNKHVTSERGYAYHAQWNDDLNHAVYAHLTGETGRHYSNFGSFVDVVKALGQGFVLDGTRLDKHYHYLLGTDAADTHGSEHVVHIQNHDQVGNRPFGDRMIATHGRDKALLGLTAVFASPFVPMLWMGEEYGEHAPFLFFEDFSDPTLIDGVRKGRKADYAFGGAEPPDPHAASSFEASKLQWQRLATAEGQAILRYCKELIRLKRSGELGSRDRSAVQVSGDERSGIVRVETAHTLTVMNFSAAPRRVSAPDGWALHLESGAVGPAELGPYAAAIYRRSQGLAR
jgi:maltooligosyltrehalose trehalohydrolase